MAVCGHAQTSAVQKQTGSNRLTGDFKVPSGKTVTIESGGTLDALPGSTVNILGGLTGIAPGSAPYVTLTNDPDLTDDFALADLSTGIVTVTTTTGVLSSFSTSAGLAAAISDETGTGSAVLNNTPTLITPNITGAITFEDGVRQTFNPSGSTPGFNFGSQAGNPSSLSNGDVWYNSSTGAVTARVNSVTGTFPLGPTATTDNALVRWDAAAGAFVQNSNVTLLDSGTSLIFSNSGGLTATVGGIFFTVSSAARVARTIGASAITANNIPASVYQSTTAANNSGTGETTLYTQSVAASTLATNGDQLHFTTVITFAANANTKQVRVKWGATTIYDSTALAINGGTVIIEAIVTRTGAATQNVYAWVVGSNATLTSGANFTTATETLSGAINFVLTGQSNTASNDITAKEFILTWRPAP